MLLVDDQMHLLLILLRHAPQPLVAHINLDHRVLLHTQLIYHCRS
jgi:hypothetical protein